MPNATVLRIWGEDHMDYLQSQVTQDLSRRDGQNAHYGLWLNDRGRVEGESYFLDDGSDSHLVIGFHTSRETLSRLIERHIIADDVEFEVIGENWLTLGIPGDGGGSKFLQNMGLETPGKDRFHRNAEGTMVFREERGASPLYIVTGSEDSLGHLTGNQFSPEERTLWVRERIERLIPAIPEEAGSRDTPFDLNLEEHAISHTKGCFLGQEVIARLKTQGRISKRLYRMRGVLDGSGSMRTIATGTAVFRGSRKVGRILCSYQHDEDWRALVQLKVHEKEAGENLSIEEAPFIEELVLF